MVASKSGLSSGYDSCFIFPARQRLTMFGTLKAQLSLSNSDLLHSFTYLLAAMASPGGDGINTSIDDIPIVSPMDNVPVQQQIVIASILVACMIAGVILLSLVLQTLRRRGYFSSSEEEEGGHESIFTSSRLMDAMGGRFISLTERRRREQALSKTKPSVINLPIKSLNGTETMAWDKLQPICAQVEDGDDDDSPYEATKSSPASSFDAKSPPYGGVTVGTIIMMPTMAPKRAQAPVVHLEMMLGTSRV